MFTRKPKTVAAVIANFLTVIEDLLAAGRAYRCRCSAEEIEERKRQTIATGGKWTYDGRCRDLDLGADGGPHTVRLRLPDEGRLDWDDLVFGASGQEAREIPVAVLLREVVE